MSSCCTSTACTTASDAAGELCPACGTTGIAVEPVTLKALLTPDGLRRGVPSSPRYCPNAQCDVVYFDNAAGVVFRETGVIVPVHAKHPDNDAIPVCYCFGYTEKSIRDEIERTGASTATQSVTAEVKAGHCACEVRNPKGSCCLGDIARVERQVASRLTLATSSNLPKAISREDAKTQRRTTHPGLDPSCLSFLRVFASSREPVSLSRHPPRDESLRDLKELRTCRSPSPGRSATLSPPRRSCSGERGNKAGFLAWITPRWPGSRPPRSSGPPRATSSGNRWPGRRAVPSGTR